MNNAGNDAILVLGMHRSGTSAVAGALNLLGADLPRRMIAPASDNPKGFWEPASVLGTNDWILLQGSATWYECLQFDSAALAERTRATALTFIMLSMMAEFGGASLPIIKDPRLSVLLDLWLPALDAQGRTPVVLLTLRSPDAVAASLETRDHLPSAITAALWLRYMLAAEHASRGRRRHIVVYDELIRDWRRALSTAADRAGLDFPVSVEEAGPELDQFLIPPRRRVGGTSARMALASMPFGTWLEGTYAALLALARDGDDVRQMERLDRVHMAFLGWCRSHARAWSGFYLREHRLLSMPSFEVPAEWHRIAAELTMPTAVPAA